MFLAALATPSPDPDLTSAWEVSPGMGGFLAFAVLGVALWLLVWSMSRHLRRVNLNEEQRDERESAEAASPDAARDA